MLSNVLGKKILRSAVVFSVSALAFVGVTMMPTQADAHFLSIVPRDAETKIGEEHTVYTSMTHVTNEGQFYLGFFKDYFGYDVPRSVMKGNFIYKDGAKTVLPTFIDYNLSHPQSPDVFDSHVSKARIEKAGTVIVDMNSEFDLPKQMAQMMSFGSARMFAHSKQLVNLTKDGFSKESTAPKGYAEIIPLSDLADAKLGEPLKFKLVLDGKPRSGDEIMWSDAKSEVYIDEQEGPMSQKELCKTAKDGIFEYTPQNEGQHFLGAEVMIVPGISGRSIDMHMPTLHFNVGKETESGSGCNGGFAALALLAVVPIIARKKGNIVTRKLS